jgi:hypothetical protein
MKKPPENLTLEYFLAPYRKAVSLRAQYQKGCPFAPEPGFWKDIVIKPLIVALRRHLHCPIAFSGPCGFKTRFYLHAGDQGSIELVWMGPDLGIGRTDYSKDSGEYPPESIGFWNGLNYPDFPLPETTTVADLAAMIREEGEKTKDTETTKETEANHETGTDTCQFVAGN